MQSCIHFMNLKRLNRLAHMRLKKGRDQTHEVIPMQVLSALYELFVKKEKKPSLGYVHLFIHLLKKCCIRPLLC